MFHVPHGISYAVENSNWGSTLARKLGFWWIDKDSHVTKDGVWVFGHWGKVAKNGFVLPRWFKQKYGKNPGIGEVYWADLAKLRTPYIWFHGHRRFRFVTAAAGLRRIHKLGMGCGAEQKGDPAFTQEWFWQNAGNIMRDVGLANDHLVVMTLPNMAHAGKVLAAAHAAGRETMVIRAETGVPRSWQPNMTWYRGRIQWLEHA